MVEVVLVVGAVAADRHRRRQGVAAPAGAADALLVVGPLRRHVAQQHRQQRPDVHAGFHGRGHRQHVDAVRQRRFAAQEDPLEQRLAALPEVAAGLAGELLDVHPGDGPAFGGQRRVVVAGPQVGGGDRFGVRHRPVAVLAGSGVAVQVHPRALRAAPRLLAAGDDDQPVHPQQPPLGAAAQAGQVRPGPGDELVVVGAAAVGGCAQPRPDRPRRAGVGVAAWRWPS